MYLVDATLFLFVQLIESRRLFLSVRFPEDVEDDGTTFHPEYSHQIFGDEWVFCVATAVHYL